MTRLPIRLRVAPVLALAVVLCTPAHGEAPSQSKPGDGLTREAFADPATPPPAPTAPRIARRTRAKRTYVDSKDFLSVHHTRQQHRSAKAQTQTAAATRPAKRRNPVASFVYWWNGFVIKTFHTKVGTVMLGTIGAKS